MSRVDMILLKLLGLVHGLLVVRELGGAVGDLGGKYEPHLRVSQPGAEVGERELRSVTWS